MRSFALSLFAAACNAIQIAEHHDSHEPDEYSHVHQEEGEAFFSKDVDVVYEELEYDIVYDPVPEIRTRQVEVPFTCEETEIKYRMESEERFTTNYDVKYK